MTGEKEKFNTPAKSKKILGFKVILAAALTSEASKISNEALKADAPVAIKAFVNNYLIFGIIGAVLSSVAFIIGLIPGRKKEF